jgi:hypothetical protein
MKVLIKYSGGNTYHTQIVDADTGKTIEGIKRAEFVFDANNELPVLKLFLHDYACEILGDASLAYDVPVPFRLRARKAMSKLTNRLAWSWYWIESYVRVRTKRK